ncbi:MAG: 50S ribosomal protein L24 [Patescibacteria group bacterium]
MKIRTGDTVKILVGKDVGKKGKVEKVFPKKGTVLVEGINVVQKHVAPAREREGGIIEKNMPVDVSNVMLICPHCEEPSRVGYKFVGDEKLRVCKKCDSIIEER